MEGRKVEPPPSVPVYARVYCPCSYKANVIAHALAGRECLTVERSAEDRKCVRAKPEVETRPTQSTLAPMSLQPVIDVVISVARRPPSSRPCRTVAAPLRQFSVPVHGRPGHRKSRDERIRERDVADIDDDESARRCRRRPRTTRQLQRPAVGPAWCCQSTVGSPRLERPSTSSNVTRLRTLGRPRRIHWTGVAEVGLDPNSITVIPRIFRATFVTE